MSDENSCPQISSANLLIYAIPLVQKRLHCHTQQNDGVAHVQGGRGIVRSVKKKWETAKILAECNAPCGRRANITKYSGRGAGHLPSVCLHRYKDSCASVRKVLPRFSAMRSRTLVGVLLSLQVILVGVELSSADDESAPSATLPTSVDERKVLLECQHPDYRTYIKCLKRQKRHHLHNDHDGDGGELRALLHRVGPAINFSNLTFDVFKIVENFYICLRFFVLLILLMELIDRLLILYFILIFYKFGCMKFLESGSTILSRAKYCSRHFLEDLNRWRIFLYIDLVLTVTDCTSGSSIDVEGSDARRRLKTFDRENPGWPVGKTVLCHEATWSQKKTNFRKSNNIKFQSTLKASQRSVTNTKVSSIIHDQLCRTCF